MKYADFEKHMRSTLDGAKEHVEMDALLGALDLRPEKSSRRYLLWFLVPALLLASVGIYMSWIMPESKAQLSENNTEVSSLDQKVYNKDLIVATSSESISDEKQNDINDQQHGKRENAILNSDSESEETSTYQKYRKQKKSEEVNSYRVNKNNLESNNKSFQNSNLDNKNKEFIRSESAFFVPETIKSDQIDETVRFSEEEGLLDFTSHDKRTSNLRGANDANLNRVEKPSESVSLLTREKMDVDLLSQTDDASELFKRMKVNCPSFSHVPWKISWVPEIGVHQPFKSISSRNNESSIVLDKRMEDEVSRPDFNFGIYALFSRDNSPFHIKAGISTSKFTERMDLSYNYTERDTTVGIISTTVSTSGDTITYIYGDIITETEYSGTNTRHHYFRTFDIPISGIYNTYVGPFDIGLEAGVKFNITTRSSGNLLISESEYTRLPASNTFNNKVGISYFGGLVIGRNFGRYGDIYLAPRFTYYQEEFSVLSNPISQKYITLGINVGCIYRL